MKKKIPLEILELIQPFLDKNKLIIKSKKLSDCFIVIYDNDVDSDFYFKVVRQEVSNNKRGYIIEYKPTSKTIIKETSQWSQINDISGYLTNWVSLINAYNSIHTTFDDPIIKSNQQRFEKDFHIVDEDADSSSFSLNQIIFLDEYLETSKNKISLLRQTADNDKALELEELEREATLIKNDLTNQTKKQIFKRLTKFWAKAQKIGLDVIREIFINVTSEITKRLLQGEN